MVSDLCPQLKLCLEISHFFFYVIGRKSTAYCTLKTVLCISEEQWKLFVDFTWLPTMLPTKYPRFSGHQNPIPFKSIKGCFQGICVVFVDTDYMDPTRSALWKGRKTIM